MSLAKKTLLALGSGPGIGRSVAALFVTKGYTNVILIARRAEQLEEEKKCLQNFDVTHTHSLLQALKHADAAFGKPEVVFYNAARVLPSALLTHPVEDVEYDFKINVSALYVVSQRYLPHLVLLAKADPSSKPSLIVTSSALPHHPIPQLFTLSLVKAAQRNLVQSLGLTYTSEGVHVGVINVAGPVSPEDQVRSPTRIAAKTWEWFEGARQQPRFEVVI